MRSVECGMKSLFYSALRTRHSALKEGAIAPDGMKKLYQTQFTHKESETCTKN
jgi:hypothetical protein